VLRPNETTGDEDGDELAVVEVVELVELVELVVIVEDARVLDELDVEVDDTAASRTRNPGLDNCALYWSYVEVFGLNRKTYFALLARLLSGIAIVHA
jgi:hypothetical protein